MKDKIGFYITYPKRIKFGTITLDRESLILKLGTYKLQCKLTTPAELEKILNKKIDKLRASMKKNKI